MTTAPAKAGALVVLTITGVGRITRKRTYCEKHSPSFAYVVNNRHALHLLEQITPYLKTYKARRARLIVRDYVELTPPGIGLESMAQRPIQ